MEIVIKILYKVRKKNSAAGNKAASVFGDFIRYALF